MDEAEIIPDDASFMQYIMLLLPLPTINQESLSTVFKILGTNFRIKAYFDLMQNRVSFIIICFGQERFRWFNLQTTIILRTSRVGRVLSHNIHLISGFEVTLANVRYEDIQPYLPVYYQEHHRILKIKLQVLSPSAVPHHDTHCPSQLSKKKKSSLLVQRNASGDSLESEVEAYCPGLKKTGVVIGKPAEFTIGCQKAGVYKTLDVNINVGEPSDPNNVQIFCPEIEPDVRAGEGLNDLHPELRLTSDVSNSSMENSNDAQFPDNQPRLNYLHPELRLTSDVSNSSKENSNDAQFPDNQPRLNYLHPELRLTSDVSNSSKENSNDAQFPDNQPRLNDLHPELRLTSDVSNSSMENSNDAQFPDNQPRDEANSQKEEVDETDVIKEIDGEDILLEDTDFLSSILSSLPGVNVQSNVVRLAIGDKSQKNI